MRVEQVDDWVARQEVWSVSFHPTSGSLVSAFVIALFSDDVDAEEFIAKCHGKNQLSHYTVEKLD